MAFTPQQRTARARKAGLARHSTDTYIKQLVDRAPTLTAAQLDRLSAVFSSACREAAKDES